MFVVRTYSINHEATHYKQKTETKIWGRHTGASPAALFMPRMELVRSDRPFLFNKNSYSMRTNESKQRCSTKNSSALCVSGEVFPQQLTKALQLISEANSLINSFNEANPDLRECIWENVFKIDILLVQSVNQISDILGFYFRDKFYFESGKEVAA